MIFKDKEVMETLRAIQNKLDMVIAMTKTDRIKRAVESAKVKKKECSCEKQKEKQPD